MQFMTPTSGTNTASTQILQQSLNDQITALADTITALNSSLTDLGLTQQQTADLLSDVSENIGIIQGILTS